MAKTVSEHNLISQVCRQLCCLSKILLASWPFRLFLSSMPIPWLVPCRHVFIAFTHWKMGRRPMWAKPIGKEGEIFSLPSLDARRTHQILSINRTLDKRSAWVRESGPSFPETKGAYLIFPSYESLRWHFIGENYSFSDNYIRNIWLRGNQGLPKRLYNENITLALDESSRNEYSAPLHRVRISYCKLVFS